MNPATKAKSKPKGDGKRKRPEHPHLIGDDPKAQRWSLLAELERLGRELGEGALPSPDSLRSVVAGLVHYLATGTLDAPAAPEDGGIVAADPRDAELAAARQRISELEAQGDDSPVAAAEPGTVPGLESGS